MRIAEKTKEAALVLENNVASGMASSSRPEQAATLNSQINETLINHLTKLLEEKASTKKIPSLPKAPISPRAVETKSTTKSSQQQRQRCYEQPDSGSCFRVFEPSNLDDQLNRNLVPPLIFQTDLVDSENSSTISK